MLALLLFQLQNIILSADCLSIPSSSNPTISDDLRRDLADTTPRILQWNFEKRSSHAQTHASLKGSAAVPNFSKHHRFFRWGSVLQKTIIVLFTGSIIAIAGLVFYTYTNTPKYVESSSAKTPTLPNQFNINERILTFGDVFDIQTTTERLGTVKQKIIAIRRIFTYGNKENQIVARATQELISWGVKIHVEDAQGRRIGSIQEKVFKSLLKVYTQYEILDANGVQIATSEKAEILRPKIVISDMKGARVATLTRNYFNILRDKWSVEIQNPDVIDQRILVMIAAYKTSVDNDRRSSDSSSSKSSLGFASPFSRLGEDRAAVMLASSY